MENVFRYALALGYACAIASIASAANVTPTKAGGDFISGSGIPADNFTIDTAVGGESVALKGRMRDTGQPLSQSGNVYYVSTGLATDNTNPAWVFDYQFSPGASGGSPDNYILALQVDFDPDVGSTNYATIALPIGDADADPTNSWDDGDGFFTNPGPGLWSDDDVDFVVSNSWHLDFAFWSAITSMDYDPDVRGEYQINMWLGPPVEPPASSTIFVNVVPEPATLGLALMGGLFGTAVYLRRRWG